MIIWGGTLGDRLGENSGGSSGEGLWGIIWGGTLGDHLGRDSAGSEARRSQEEPGPASQQPGTDRNCLPNVPSELSRYHDNFWFCEVPRLSSGYSLLPHNSFILSPDGLSESLPQMIPQSPSPDCPPESLPRLSPMTLGDHLGKDSGGSSGEELWGIVRLRWHKIHDQQQASPVNRTNS